MSKKWIEKEHINELTLRVINDLFNDSLVDEILYNHTSFICGESNLTSIVYDNVHKVIRQLKLEIPLTWMCPYCQKEEVDYGSICDKCTNMGTIIDKL